ncbi:SDR family NAD(P)-dependent oxidoreductase, partial [Spirochaetota bacterium]
SDIVLSVTGSTIGIGKKISELLLKEGCNVVISSRSKDKVKSVVSEFKKEYGDAVTGYPCDVKDIKSVQKLVDHTLESFGSIEILVANAGITSLYGPFNKLSQKELNEITDNVIGTNLTGAINCVSAVLPAMISKKYGRIITLGGAGSDQKRPMPHHIVYAASKGGVINFSMCLAKELEEDEEDIKINVFQPGIIKTNMVTSSKVVRNWITNEELQKQTSLVLDHLGSDIEESCKNVIPYASPACKENGTVFRGFSIKKMIFGGIKLKKAMKQLKEN